MIITWPPTKELLTELYINQQLDMVQIGLAAGKDPKTVWHWMKKLEVATRGRGGHSGHEFKKGQPSAFKGKNHTEENKNKIRQQRLLDGHVPYLKDGIHWLKHQGAKPASWQGGITPERQRIYSSPKWIDLVKEVWRRDNATCQKCGIDHRSVDRSKIKFHIHHKVSFQKKAWRYELENLTLLCGPCHRWVHSKLNVNKELICQLRVLEVPKWLKSKELTK
jgi:hypothetical protein